MDHHEHAASASVDLSSARELTGARDRNGIRKPYSGGLIGYSRDAVFEQLQRVLARFRYRTQSVDASQRAIVAERAKVFVSPFLSNSGRIAARVDRGAEGGSHLTIESGPLYATVGPLDPWFHRRAVNQLLRALRDALIPRQDDEKDTIRNG